MKNLLYAAKPLALDLLSTLVFVVLSALTHNILLATGVAMAAGAGRVVYLRLRGERVGAMQWMSLGLVTVFGRPPCSPMMRGS
jgi:intracellular septation protein